MCMCLSSFSGSLTPQSPLIWLLLQGLLAPFCFFLLFRVMGSFFLLLPQMWVYSYYLRLCCFFLNDQIYYHGFLFLIGFCWIVMPGLYCLYGRKKIWRAWAGIWVKPWDSVICIWQVSSNLLWVSNMWKLQSVLHVSIKQFNCRIDCSKKGMYSVVWECLLFRHGMFNLQYHKWTILRCILYALNNLYMKNHRYRHSI